MQHSLLRTLNRSEPRVRATGPSTAPLAWGACGVRCNSGIFKTDEMLLSLKKGRARIFAMTLHVRGQKKPDIAPEIEPWIVRSPLPPNSERLLISILARLICPGSCTSNLHKVHYLHQDCVLVLDEHLSCEEE